MNQAPDGRRARDDREIRVVAAINLSVLPIAPPDRLDPSWSPSNPDHRGWRPMMNRTIDTNLAKDYRRADLRIARRSQGSATESKPATEVRSGLEQPRLAVLHRLVARLA
jgi:hypothetical protein